MCTAATARRRRAQARNGFRHLPKRIRPHYKRRDLETSQRRLQRVIATENRLRQSKKK